MTEPLNKPSEAVISPEQSRLLVNQESLYSLIKGQKPPADDTDHHSFLRPIKLNSNSIGAQDLNNYLDFCMYELTGNRGKRQAAQIRGHLEYVLLNLSRTMFQRCWVLVALKKSDYATDYWLKHYGLRYTAMKAVIDYLLKYDLIKLLPGKQYEKQPMRTRIFPAPKLQMSIWEYFLDTEEAIEPPYVTINQPTGSYGGIITKLPKSNPDSKDMATINEFLKGHRWACKGPVRLTYKHTPFESGRLFTAFQRLPDKRMRLRINTLIDGKPICEVDFNANHLRLNLAVLAGEDAGETPYEDICEAAGLPVEKSKRDLVKKFVTISMGASDRESAKSASYKNSISNKMFEKLETATLKRFPKVALYIGFGINAQNLEGQILKQVMLEGVKKGIVALPVHDAVAVQQGNEGWAKEAMLRAWAEHANSDGGTAQARVKVDYPEEIN